MCKASASARRSGVLAVLWGSSIAVVGCGSPPTETVDRDQTVDVCVTVVLDADDIKPRFVALPVYQVPERQTIQGTPGTRLRAVYGFDSAPEREAWLGPDGELEHDLVFLETFEAVQETVVEFDDEGVGVLSFDRPSRADLEALSFVSGDWYRQMVMLADGPDLVLIEAVGPPLEIC